MSNLFSTEDMDIGGGAVDYFTLPLAINHQLGDEQSREKVFRFIDFARSKIKEGNILNASGIDDFSVLLMYAYGVEEDQIAVIGVEGVQKLEKGIRRLKDKKIDDVRIAETVQKAVVKILSGQKSATSMIENRDDGRDTEVQRYTKPPLTTALTHRDGRRGWFLHSYIKFQYQGLPMYIVYTQDGDIEDWSPRDVTVGDEQNLKVCNQAFPQRAIVKVIERIARQRYVKKRARIVKIDVSSGELRILVRHPDNERNEHGDLIEDWITPNQISSFES